VGPLLFVALGLAAVYMAQHLDRRAAAEGFALIETNRISLDLEGAAEGWATWLDPRWSEMLEARLAALDDFRADDPDGVAAVVAAMNEFSFIEELGTPRVIWPDGLEISLRLRRPVACIAFEGRFYPVAIDWQQGAGPRGVILPGGGATPPAFRGAFLPVIGGIKGSLASVWLEDPVVLGALSIADSMWVELDLTSAEKLGRIVIDATKDAEATVEEPGTRLFLEAGREVLFGRSPYREAAGELDTASKWANLARALAELPGHDWDELDLRWDTPKIHYRE
jgi:hypothetical protein